MKGANMKKAALGFIALAMSFMANTAQAYNGEGDIRSINRCDYDGKVLSAMAADEFAIAGDTVYFRIRLKNVNSQEIKTSGAQNRWVLKNISGDDDAEPTVGVYVSGQFRVAKIVDVKVPTEVDVNANGSSKAEWLPCYTDLICAYTVQPGDFAFPMTLANSSKGEVNANGGDSYWLNPDFELQAKEYTSAPPWDESSTYSIVKSTFTFGPEQDGYIAASESAFWSRDFSLDQANIRIKTLDFVESEVFMDLGDPRIIDVKFHGGTNSVGGSAYLKIKNDGKFDLVKTGAASVTVKSMKGPDGSVDEYQCLKVEVPAGVSSFQIKVLGNEKDAEGVLYLSSTEAFAQGKSGNHIENYITAVVRCGPPKRRVSVEINPADLTLTNGTAKATVTPSPDYATALRRLTVKLSTAYTNDVKVKVDASMISAAASGIEPVGEYIGLSTLAVDGYLGTDDTVTFTVDEMNRGLLSKDIYVYVLGGDAETSGTGKGILFTPSIVDNAAADTFYNESPITSVLMIEKSVPQIIEPTAGHRYDNIPGGVEYTFEIKVADGYNDIGGEYEIEWKKKTNDANAKVSFEDDVKKPNSEGYLYVKVKYNSGEYTSRFRVKNASGSYSEWRTITVQVDDAKQAYAVVEGFEDVIEFGEIDEEGYENVLDVRFHLNVPHEDTVYAFLVPLDEASSNKVEFVSGKGKEIGIAIPGGTTNSVQTATLRLLDGCDETLPISYRIELRTLKYPDSELFEGAYECKDLELYVNNVYPVINSVGMSGSLDVSENGGTFSGRASIGLQKVFTLDVIDSEADWLGNAHAVWTFADPNGFVGAPVEYDGPLCDVCVTNIFTVPGTYTCNVKLQDKDMLGGRRYSESFEFKVMVNDTPSVLIEFPNSNTFLETDAEKGTGYFDVKLSMPATKPVVVELDCTQVGADGVLNISTNRLEFRAGQVQQRVLIEELDGTADSMSFKGGFSVTAKVVTTDTNEDGIEFKDVYLPVTEKMYVANENPTIVFPISTGGTNDASINVEYNLSWKIADVDFDLADGLSVVWTTSEGDRWVAPGTDVSEGVYVAKFKTGGAKTVTMTVTDKDGGVSSVSLFYKVAASKQVYVYPMGPYDGGLTSLSRRYATASGIGEGRAWADGTRVSTNFVHTYTYGATMGTATVSAKAMRF